MAKSLRNTLRIFAALLALYALDVAAAPKKKKKPAEPTPRSRASQMQEDEPQPARSSRTRPEAAPRFYRQLAEGELPLMAAGAIVLDAFTGKPLYEKSADQANYPASTTKIIMQAQSSEIASTAEVSGSVVAEWPPR